MTDLEKQQFDALAKQRDSACACLAHLIDAVYSGCLNGWDLPDSAFPHSGGKAPGPSDGFDEWMRKLHGDHFHLWYLLSQIKDYMDMPDNPLEGKWDMNVVRDHLKKELPEHFRFEDTATYKPEDLYRSILLFCLEYSPTHDYPGADRAVYADSLDNIAVITMKLAGIKPGDDESLKKFLLDEPAAGK